MMSKTRFAVAVVVIAFWAVMMGLFFWRQQETPGLAGGAPAFDPRATAREAWYGVYLADGSPGGLLHLLRQPESRNGALGQRLRLEGQFALEVLGQAADLEVLGDVWRTASPASLELAFEVRAGEQQTRLEGRVEDGRLRATVATGGRQVPVNLPVRGEALLSAGFGTHLDLPDLEVGQRAVVDSFDPLSLGTGRTVLECIGEEEIHVGEGRWRARVIRGESGGLAWRAWLSPTGEVLRAETPLGLTLEQIGPAAARQLEGELASPATPSDDAGALLAETMVRSRGERPRRGARLLRFAAQGVDRTLPADDVQQALADGSYRIEVPPLTEGSGGESENLDDFLRSEIFIQASDPRIKAQAREIVAGEQDAWQKALRLHRWVFEEVEKVPVLSLPSAVEVLASRRGDCNEHAVLYTALARASGLPTRIAVGLVWSEDQEGFFYHAWPEVYVGGRWIWMDPTLGQSVADATHVKLLSGGIETWTQLLPFLGRLELEILEVR